MSKGRKIILLSAIVLTIIFVISFLVFDNMLTKRNEGNTDTNETTSNKENDSLKDNVRISLYTGENREKESTLKELKKQLGIDGDITEEELCETLSKNGYELDSNYGNEIIFSRDVESSIEPNKYYIKADDDGFLAIFKSDNEGNLSIENKDTDIYNKKISELPKIDQEQITSLKCKYDSKDDADEFMSQFIS